jgi:hypothetical protein
MSYLFHDPKIDFFYISKKPESTSLKETETEPSPKKTQLHNISDTAIKLSLFT